MAFLPSFAESGESESQVWDAAWNRCAVDLVEASRAHCEYVIARSFVLYIQPPQSHSASPSASQSGQQKDSEEGHGSSSLREPLMDPAVAAAMNRLAALYILNLICDHASDLGTWLSPSQVATVREAVRSLLALIRPDAVALVDAFEFPDNVLSSALGRRDGRVYESLYAAAKASPLNARDPFEGYERVLRPHLDLEFLEEGAAKVRSAPLGRRPQQRSRL